MNAPCLRVLLGLVGCGFGGAALAATVEPAPSVAPQVLVDPAAAILSAVNDPPILPGPNAGSHYGAIKAKTARRRALIVRHLALGGELLVVARPDVASLDTAWSPMVAMEDSPLTPSNAVRKLEVREPLLRLEW